MKYAILMILSASLVCTACGGGKTTQNGGTGPEGPKIIEEGWVSDSEFRVKVSVETDSVTTGSDAIKKASENAALKKAKETVVRNFVALRVKSSPSAGNYAVAAMAIDREFRDTIEKGRVVSKIFESGDRKCTMVYEVERSNLKKAVEQGSK